jgi:hypothetical protein
LVTPAGHSKPGVPSLPEAAAQVGGSRARLILRAVGRVRARERPVSEVGFRGLSSPVGCLGYASDEYPDREALDSHHQDLFSAEIANGQRRLQGLAMAISHFKFLKAATLSRFPDHKPGQPSLNSSCKRRDRPQALADS